MGTSLHSLQYAETMSNAGYTILPSVNDVVACIEWLARP
jgi:hypothetical protein